MHAVGTYFPEDLIRLVAVGEQTGFLEDVLQSYACQQKKRQEIHNKFRKALVYPLLVLASGLVLILYTLFFILPMFQTVFADLNSSLPVSTRLLLGLSGWMQTKWLFIVVIGPGVFILLGKWIKSTGVRAQCARWFWASCWGKRFWLSKTFWLVSRFLTAGIPLVEALDLTRGIISNPVFRHQWLRLSHFCQQGYAFYDSTRQCHFPQECSHLLKSMEESGRLKDGLEKVAENYQAELEHFGEIVSTLLEPAAILMVGVGVGVIVWSLFSPLVQLTQQMI